MMLDASVGPKLPLRHVIPVASQSFAYLEAYLQRVTQKKAALAASLLV